MISVQARVGEKVVPRLRELAPCSMRETGDEIHATWEPLVSNSVPSQGLMLSASGSGHLEDKHSVPIRDRCFP